MDRDDRGNYLDTITVDGVKTVNPLNQETVSIRRNIPGEYIVNVYRFSDDSGAPTPVSVCDFTPLLRDLIARIGRELDGLVVVVFLGQFDSENLRSAVDQLTKPMGHAIVRRRERGSEQYAVVAINQECPNMAIAIELHYQAAQTLLAVHFLIGIVHGRLRNAFSDGDSRPHFGFNLARGIP